MINYSEKTTISDSDQVGFRLHLEPRRRSFARCVQDVAIEQIRNEITLIREYRDRLIADVVTGQIDVRGWQPGPDDMVNDEDLAALGDDEECEESAEEDDDGAD